MRLGNDIFVRDVSPLPSSPSPRRSQPQDRRQPHETVPWRLNDLCSRQMARSRGSLHVGFGWRMNLQWAVFSLAEDVSRLGGGLLQSGTGLALE
jgi:hypothetical protein